MTKCFLFSIKESWFFYVVVVWMFCYMFCYISFVMNVFFTAIIAKILFHVKELPVGAPFLYHHVFTVDSYRNLYITEQQNQLNSVAYSRDIIPKWMLAVICH